MFIKIKPLDTFFFRTARPFTKGEDTWSDFVFPPYPSTLYGALRSFAIFQKGKLKDFYDGKFRENLGTPNEKGKMKIKGPVLFFEDEAIFKAPYDLVKLKEGDGCLYPLQFCQKPSLMFSKYNLDNIVLWKKNEVADDTQGWLRFSRFEDYLKTKKEKFEYRKNEDYFLREEKTGITRDGVSKTSKEGDLYRISMIRMKEKSGFFAEIEGINDFPEKGVLQLGGENKGAVFEKCKDLMKDLKTIKLNLKEGLFKVYFATPAIFKKGWLPDWIDENTLEGQVGGIKLKLLACAIGKPIPVGGWNLADKCSKPLRKAVPAGSVYYFKVLNGADVDKVKEVFHLENISDINAEEGFGLAIVGETGL